MSINLHGGRIGILAGSGDLPKEIIAKCQSDDIDFFAVYFKGQSDQDVIDDIPSKIVKLGQTQKTINILKAENCTHIIFAGGIKRPGLFDIKPDIRTTKLFAKLGLGAVGDDRLLRAIRGELESEGFLILGAHDILPNLVTEKGILGDIEPDDVDMADIQFGWQVLEDMGRHDIGQACIVQQGVVLGVEAIEGTDALIERAGQYLRSGGGGVLVKRSKPNQDQSMDLPTVGEVTIENLAEAGLKGLALEAGASQILNPSETISHADSNRIFVIGVTKEDLK
tara:strand:- start:449 stop:1291 length:843 start_codon:yes stop_codon:yes gene_type:complete